MKQNRIIVIQGLLETLYTWRPHREHGWLSIHSAGVMLGVISMVFLFSGCEDDMKECYKKAMDAYREEDYQTAVLRFEDILMKYPEHNLTRKVRYELGNLYFYKLKQPEQAVKHLQELYAQAETGTYAMEALKLLGSIYEETQNDCLQSVDVYRHLLNEFSLNDVEAGQYQYTIAECYFKLGEYDMARKEYQTLVERYPNSSSRLRAEFRIANSYALQEEWETAIALHEQLAQVEQLPEQLIVDNNMELAFCYIHEEQFENALKIYEGLQIVDSDAVVIDKSVLGRKIERVKELIEEGRKGPSDVEWKRKKK